MKRTGKPMSASESLSEKPAGEILFRHGFWLVPLLAATVLSLLVYGVFPAIGLDRAASLLNPLNIFVLVFLVVAGVGYTAYFRYVLREPKWLALFLVAGWALANGVNEWLLGLGLNLRFRPLIMLVLGIPALALMASHRQVLWRLPHFRFYLLFILWLGLYFVFFNAWATDPQLYREGTVSEGSTGIFQAVSYFYNLLAIGVAAVAVYTAERSEPYFDWLNRWLLIISIGVAAYTIIGYPFMLTSQWLDGFNRAHGIFSHPNPFAHHTGLLLLYNLGLYFYYQDENKGRISGMLLTGALLANLCAFLLGLSKTAIMVAGICIVLIFLLNLSSPKIRRNVLTGTVCMAALIPLGLALYAWVTDESFFTMVQRRLDNTHSMDWRLQVWDYLLSGIHGTALLTGHGFTAANVWVYQLLYNSETNVRPLMMVHNGYIALLYDLGVMGLLYFAAVLTLFGKALRRMFEMGHRRTRPLLSAIIALCVYFLAVCAFDEATYMFDAPILFWVFATTLYGMAFREDAHAARS